MTSLTKAQPLHGALTSGHLLLRFGYIVCRVPSGSIIFPLGVKVNFMEMSSWSAVSEHVTLVTTI